VSTLEIADASIHYDIEGRPDGFPVLLIAPGGMRSANELWNTMPWNPRRVLAGDYLLVGMDQRNAGRSTAPVSGDDGWATYAADQIGLLDQLGIGRCHVVGMCIGGPYVIGLLRAAPERFASAVLLQPVGVDGNRSELLAMFDQWAAAIGDQHPEAFDDDWSRFRSNMWDGGFVLTATPDEVATITTPMLVMMGDDVYHPQSTSRQIAELASNATLVERWKDDASLPATDATIKRFLAACTP
jgi:pimeloyl-ACP methyl ester carboxylesterase